MKSELRHALNVGREHYRAGEFDKAEPFLLDVLTQHDGFADVHNMIGVIRHQRGQTEVASTSFERALAINPRYTEAALNLSVCLNELGRYEEAKKAYGQASGERAKGGDAPLAHASQAGELDDFVRGKIANLHAEVGAAYEAVGMNTAAVAEYRKALELCPTFADIRTRLGTTLRDSDQLDEAIDELTALRESAPDYLPARLQLGVALWSAGRKDDARKEWEFVLSKDENNRSAKVYLAMQES